MSLWLLMADYLSGRPCCPMESTPLTTRTLPKLSRPCDLNELPPGPMIAEFERALADYSGAKHAVAFSSGTAALHAAAYAAELGPGDEVVTTPLTFVATANCALYQGGNACIRRHTP